MPLPTTRMTSSLLAGFGSPAYDSSTYRGGCRAACPT
jgi:hypothetical protein